MGKREREGGGCRCNEGRESNRVSAGRRRVS